MDIKLPNITICPDQQIDAEGIKGLGYQNEELLIAGVVNNTLISWGSHIGLSFQELLNKSYTVGREDLTQILALKNMTSNLRYIPKFGFCAVISKYDVSKNLEFELNNWKGQSLVFLTDSDGASMFNMDYSSHIGDRILLEPFTVLTYKVDVNHVDEKNADTVDCGGQEYENVKQCADEGSEAYIKKYLDCYPPWMSDYNQCTSSITNNNSILTYMKTGFYDEFVRPMFYYQPTLVEEECNKCMIRTQSHVKLIGEDKIKYDYSVLTLIFDKKVKVLKTVYAYSFFDLMFDIGGNYTLKISLQNKEGFTSALNKINVNYKAKKKLYFFVPLSNSVKY